MDVKSLSYSDLKGMHKMMREKYNCAVGNYSKAEASIVLGMLDEELKNRGYDVSKLFKGYNPNSRN